MRLLIVEDNAAITAGIRQVLQAEFRGEITDVCVASTVKEAQKALQSFRPNIILFDIALPDGTGFDVARYAERQAKEEEPLIFVCMSGKPPSEIIGEIVRHTVIRFLPKPFAVGELVQALREAIFASLQRQQSAILQLRERQRLEDFYRGATQAVSAATSAATAEGLTENFADIIIVQKKTANGIESIRIPMRAISHIEAQSNKCLVALQSGEAYTLSKTLATLETSLPARAFIRTHKSYIARIDYMLKINRDTITLKSGETVPLARERVKAVKTAFNKGGKVL